MKKCKVKYQITAQVGKNPSVLSFLGLRHSVHGNFEIWEKLVTVCTYWQGIGGRGIRFLEVSKVWLLSVCSFQREAGYVARASQALPGNSDNLWRQTTQQKDFFLPQTVNYSYGPAESFRLIHMHQSTHYFGLSFNSKQVCEVW